MSESSQPVNTFTQEELSLVVTALGELPAKHSYLLLKKIETILRPASEENAAS